MAVAKSYTTESGTELPLLNLRGKPYLQIAHRLVWLTEKYDRYTTNTNFLKLEDDYAICRAIINIYDAEGNLVRSASGTKKETKKDFPDFVEKAETGSIGRALASLGIGTQFCTQDMEEGNRLADSPIPPAKKTATAAKPSAKKASSSFNKQAGATTDGWA